MMNIEFSPLLLSYGRTLFANLSLKNEEAVSCQDNETHFGFLQTLISLLCVETQKPLQLSWYAKYFPQVRGGLARS